MAASETGAPPRQSRRATTPGEDFQLILAGAISSTEELAQGTETLATKIDSLSAEYRPDIAMDLRVFRASLELLKVRLELAGARFDYLKVQH